MMNSDLIFYSIAILTGIILYFLLRKKIIAKKLLQAILATWLFSSFYFTICFSFINTYGLEVFAFSANQYLHYVQIVPLIVFITFYSFYWLKHFKGKEEKSTKRQEPSDLTIIFIAFASGMALINLFLPPIHELWLKLVIMLGSGAFAGFTVGLLLWRNRKRKEYPVE